MAHLLFSSEYVGRIKWYVGECALEGVISFRGLTQVSVKELLPQVRFDVVGAARGIGSSRVIMHPNGKCFVIKES